MRLLEHGEAAVAEVRDAHEDAIAEAHAHLNGSQRSHAISTQPAAVVLKKLSNRHKQAISLLLQGLSRRDVAEATGFTPEYMSFLLQQPLAKEHIANINRAISTQLEALNEMSVNAISVGLRAIDPDVKLRAAKLQMQATGRLEPSDEGKKTAEDVVQAILLGVNVNVNTR